MSDLVPNQSLGLSGPIHVRHLLANACHDEAETWCGERTSCHDSGLPEDVSCVECLYAAFKYGQRAEIRRLHLLFPRWNPPEPDPQETTRECDCVP